MTRCKARAIRNTCVQDIMKNETYFSVHRSIERTAADGFASTARHPPKTISIQPSLTRISFTNMPAIFITLS